MKHKFYAIRYHQDTPFEFRTHRYTGRAQTMSAVLDLIEMAPEPQRGHLTHETRVEDLPDLLEPCTSASGEHFLKEWTADASVLHCTMCGGFIAGDPTTTQALQAAGFKDV